MQVLINIFLSTLITTISLHISWIPFIIVTKKQFGVMIGAKPIEKSIEDFQEILW